jgi:hypothetical protein
MADVEDFLTDALLFILASPILLVLGVRRTVARYRYLRLALQAAITCECGEPVSLVGLWRCSCGNWVYRGHLLRVCPVCRTVPVVVRCYRCGVTTKLPEPV